MTCNAPVRNYLSNSDQLKFERFQYQTLRLILELRPDPVDFREVFNVALLELIDLPTIRGDVAKLFRNLFERMLLHDNPLISDLTMRLHFHEDATMHRKRSPFLILTES